MIPNLKKEELSFIDAINSYFIGLNGILKTFAVNVLQIAKDMGLEKFKAFVTDRSESLFLDFYEEFTSKIYVCMSLRNLELVNKGDDAGLKRDVRRHLSALSPKDIHVLPMTHIHPTLKQHNSHNMESLKGHVHDLLVITRSIANNMKTVEYLKDLSTQSNSNSIYRLCGEILMAAEQEKTIARQRRISHETKKTIADEEEKKSTNDTKRTRGATKPNYQAAGGRTAAKRKRKRGTLS